MSNQDQTKTAYFFKRDACFVYDIKRDKEPGFEPERHSISELFHGLPENFQSGISAALYYNSRRYPNKIYLFKGDEYVRLDATTFKVDGSYPKKISAAWKGFEKAGFGANIDSCVNLRNGKALFFKGLNVIQFDVENETIDRAYPKPISTELSNPASPFEKLIQASVYWNVPGFSNKAYFFSGEQYLRYSVATPLGKDSGYPKLIKDEWPGFKSVGLANNINAAFTL